MVPYHPSPDLLHINQVRVLRATSKGRTPGISGGLAFQLTGYRNVGSPGQAVSSYKPHHNYVGFHFCSIQDSLLCLKHIRSESMLQISTISSALMKEYSIARQHEPSSVVSISSTNALSHSLQ